MSVQVNTPFPGEAWPRVWSWLQDFRSRVVDDYAPATLEEFVHCQILALHRQKSWGVWAGSPSGSEELCGLVVCEPLAPVLASSYAIFRRDYWGPETSGPALRAVYGEIFGGTTRKITSVVFRDNNAILSALTSLGAKREGVLRKHTMRGGKLVDMVATGLLKEDFETCRS